MANDQMRPVAQGNPARPKLDIGPFSMIPNKFFGSGMAAKLGRSPSLLFVALCEHANRNGALSFKASDAAIASDTGMGTRTISQARKRLVEFNLISCDRQDGRSYTYTLKKYEFPWRSAEERRRPKRKPRAIHALRAEALQDLPVSNSLGPE